jgi:hypothetical protein
LFCKYEDSIIVWDISILTRCPYKIVEKVELEAIYYDILYDRKKRRFFQLVKFIPARRDCAFHHWSTKQGVYTMNLLMILKEILVRAC